MVTCAACGRENPDGFRFCGSCGSPLTRDVVATREVRKMITVVFCDLAGRPSGHDLICPVIILAT